MKDACIDYLKMTLDENAPILYTKVLGIPEGSSQLEKFCTFHQSKLVEIASKNSGIVYSICDTSLLQPYSFDLLVNYYIRFVHKSNEVFKSFKIFVLPKLGTSVDVNEILKLSGKNSIYFFDSNEEAKKSVFEDWALYCKSKLEYETVNLI